MKYAEAVRSVNAYPEEILAFSLRSSVFKGRRVTRIACVLAALLAVPVLGPAQPGPRPHVAGPRHLRRRAAGDPGLGPAPARLRHQRRLARIGQLHGRAAGAAARQGRAACIAEFNTLHVADYLKDHPDAAPIGADGQVSPPPDGWQGICPTHDGYRRIRMDAFRKLLQDFAIDGVWLDYHHSHASWEQAEPNMPDTCFCDRCLRRFQDATGDPAARRDRRPSAPRCCSRRTARPGSAGGWTCSPDWVREFRAILDATRPRRCWGRSTIAWSDEDFGGARLEKLAIDLQGAGRLHRRLQPDALPRAVRPCRRSGVDLPSGGLARPVPGRRGRARRAASHLADRADLGLGRAGAASSRSRPCSTTARASRHRRDGVRVGRPAKAPRKDRGDRPHVPRVSRPARASAIVVSLSRCALRALVLQGSAGLRECRDSLARHSIVTLPTASPARGGPATAEPAATRGEAAAVRRTKAQR